MKHCILVKYKESVDEARKEQLRSEIQALFGQLLPMDGIYKVELIPNVTSLPNRYDLLIRIEMDSAVMSAYYETEVHRRWKREYGELLDKKAIFDYQ